MMFHTSNSKLKPGKLIAPQGEHSRGRFEGRMIFMSERPNVHRTIKCTSFRVTYTYEVAPTGKVYRGGEWDEWYSLDPLRIVKLHHVNRFQKKKLKG